VHINIFYGVHCRHFTNKRCVEHRRSHSRQSIESRTRPQATSTQTQALGDSKGDVGSGSAPTARGDLGGTLLRSSEEGGGSHSRFKFGGDETLSGLPPTAGGASPRGARTGTHLAERKSESILCRRASSPLTPFSQSKTHWDRSLQSRDRCRIML